MARTGIAGLTEKQARFCEEYLVDLNATQAAIRAGYNIKTARSQGSTLLTNPNVAAYIQRLREEQKTRSQVNADWVLQQLIDIATADAGDYTSIDSTGGIKYTPTDKLTKKQRSAISAIEPTTAGPKIRTYDRIRALELIGKHLGIFDRQAENSGPDVEDLSPLADMLDDNDGGDDS